MIGQRTTEYPELGGTYRDHPCPAPAAVILLLLLQIHSDCSLLLLARDYGDFKIPPGPCREKQAIKI